MRIKIIDIIIIVISASVVIFSIYLIYNKTSDKIYILIQGQGAEWIFNIDAEETVIIKGPIGETVARISGGRAWVESSPCENQNCAAAGFIKREGQWAACLPNHVLVMVKGSGENRENVDAVAW